MSLDFYKTLGVKEDATEEEIKQAYWVLAKKTHPDQNPEKEIEFRIATIAYEVLTDPLKRKGYDRNKQEFIDRYGVPESGVEDSINNRIARLKKMQERIKEI